MFPHIFRLQLPQLLLLQQSFWIRYYRISPSINSLICTELMIKSDLDSQKFVKKIKILNNFIVRNYESYMKNVSVDISSENNKSIHKYDNKQFSISKLKSQESLIQAISSDSSIRRIQEWISVIIFNIQLKNDQYIQQMQQCIKNSHQSTEVQKLKDLIYNQIKKQISMLVNMPVLAEIIEQNAQNLKISTPKNNKQIVRMQLQCLIETIEYIQSRYNLTLNYFQSLEFLKNKLTNKHNIVETQEIKSCNSLIFNNDVKSFKRILQNNYNFDLIAICKLIYANYQHYESPRSMLIGSKVCGELLLQKIGQQLINTYSKNQIFGDKNIETDRLYCLFLNAMQYCFMNVYIEWLSMISALFINEFENGCNIYEKKQIKMIDDFLANLPYKHPNYSKFIHKVYQSLLMKYQSGALSIQILKKLLLNRFLLNISLFYAFQHIDQPQITPNKDKIVSLLNQLKFLFYPKKLIHKLSEANITDKNILRISQNIQRNLFKIVSIQKTKQISENQLYLLDKNLLPQLVLVNQDFNIITKSTQKQLKFTSNFASKFLDSSQSNYQQSSQSSYHHINHSNSLSFSFVKNEASCVSGNTIKRINNYSYKNLQNISKLSNQVDPRTLTDVNSPKSMKTYKSHKTVHTQYTQNRPNQMNSIEYVWELVKTRRQYGAARKRISKNIQERKKRRQQVFRYCNIVHKQFIEVQKQLQRTLNRIKINIESS